jgi:hypothetical protein
MSKIIERIKENAEELANIRASINEIEEAAKAQTDALKAKREDLQLSLIADLKKEGLASIKTNSGESYILSKRKGVNIVNDVSALNWAIDNHAISIDRRIVAAKLAKVDDMPAGFELVETEFISVRGAKASKDE